MGKVAIIFDCEFLTAPGAPQRFWCGPFDPDPVVAQIGAVKLTADKDAEILDSFEQVVVPKGRDGSFLTVDPLFENLTGITQTRIARHGQPLRAALDAFDAFSDGAPIWSWGKDEFNMLAISCYVAGIAPPIPAVRFGNATRLLVRAGIPEAEVITLRSNTLTDYFNLPRPERPGHDALGDAQSVAAVLQHLIRSRKLDPVALTMPSLPLTPPPT
ncbi:MAG: exonuclease [Pseudomonadota bacterium]